MVVEAVGKAEKMRLFDSAVALELVGVKQANSNDFRAKKSNIADIHLLGFS